MSEHPKPTDIEKSMPIKLEGISKRLWPRKLYVKIKTYHPVAGSLFMAIWSVFWLILALTINLLMIVVILGTIILLISAIFGDSNFDLDFISPVYMGSDKKKKEEEKR